MLNVFLTVSMFLPIAEAKVEAPLTAKAGDLVVLNATQSTGDHFLWLLDADIVVQDEKGQPRWQLDAPKTFLPTDGDKKCVFASGDVGIYTFTLVVSDKDGQSHFKHKLVIGDPLNPPVVPPTTPPTTPPDKPPAPAPGYGLKNEVRAWLTPLSADARQDIPAVVGAIDAIVLKKVTFTTIEEMESVLASVVGGAMTDVNAWRPFSSSLNDSIKMLKNQQRITTVDQLAEAMTEVSEGLSMSGQ